ncbi:D-alanine--D-alanine ligase family protein [Herbiconiux ginsengi]|uniref:D-alanine--D-alanine ligase n=1 Tax=Herbiconiux ginsengi TaxID=381665 RepID=A0A1H3S076_9MICO|nr:D-alanine--D-alanine ligase [Herbiconiux ginsengi]SDZ31038.1 D-alanine-D-alanine ligase [Herbiconiux ginsengi]
MSRLQAVVIGGGRNPEHEVSLASAAAVAAGLDRSRYDVIALTIDRAGHWRDDAGIEIGLARAIDVLRGCDVAIPMVHGRLGEDGALAALCELTGVPYVGSGIGAGAIGMDKRVTKLLANAAGIPTAAAVLLDRTTAHAYRFREPVVVKPVSAGSSVGVSLVTSAAALTDAVAAALAVDDHILVEERLEGREIDVAVLRLAGGATIVTPPLEIVVDGVFDRGTKYGGHAVFRVPAVLHDEERWELERAAERMYDALDCSGVARIDFFLTSDGPVLNEVNTTPGFTAQSQVPRMFAAAGIRYSELLDLLVEGALAQRQTADARPDAPPSAHPTQQVEGCSASPEIMA